MQKYESKSLLRDQARLDLPIVLRRLFLPVFLLEWRCTLECVSETAASSLMRRGAADDGAAAVRRGTAVILVTILGVAASG